MTTRNIKDRLERELERNLALRVEPGENADAFTVSGRGTLHIAILIENMRREGYEFAVGPPKVGSVSNVSYTSWQVLQGILQLPACIDFPSICPVPCLAQDF